MQPRNEGGQPVDAEDPVAAGRILHDCSASGNRDIWRGGLLHGSIQDQQGSFIRYGHLRPGQDEEAVDAEGGGGKA